MSRQHQTCAEDNQRDAFVDEYSQRIGHYSPKDGAPLLDRGDDAAQTGSVSTIPAAALATSVAVETAIPICAWRSAGASLAPSPHMPTAWPSR